MKYIVLLELGLTHPFYADRGCPDFAIEPSDESTALLRNHRCLLRPHATGLRVILPVDGARQPFLALPVDTPLRFHLTLQSDVFALFTDLTAIRSKPAPVFTSEGSSEGELVLASRDKLPPGVFAGIELYLGGLSLDAAPLSFRVVFQARRARWAYYCVTDLAPNGGELRIVDAPPPGATDLLLFGEDPDPDDPIARQIVGWYPGMRCIRFLSDQAVACSEVPRRHLELRRGDERIAGPLPNPPLRNESPPDLLFQIIRCQTHPFQFQAP